MQSLKRYLPVSGAPEIPDEIGVWTEEVEYMPTVALGKNLRETLKKMAEVEELTSRFPGIDCGSCGAPSCRALADDIVRGEAKETDCIYIMLDVIRKMAGMVEHDVHLDQ